MGSTLILSVQKAFQCMSVIGRAKDKKENTLAVSQSNSLGMFVCKGDGSTKQAKLEE